MSHTMSAAGLVPAALLSSGHAVASVGGKVGTAAEPNSGRVAAASRFRVGCVSCAWLRGEWF